MRPSGSLRNGRLTPFGRTNTSPLSRARHQHFPSLARPRARARGCRKSKAVAGGQGRLELAGIMAERTEGLTDPDDTPAVPEHPVSQTGDLWLLGKHRLLCGDSTVATDVEREASSNPTP